MKKAHNLFKVFLKQVIKKKLHKSLQNCKIREKNKKNFAIQFPTKVQNFNLLKHIIDRSSNWLINDLMMQ